MSTIITRVGWCSKCYKAQRPRTDNFFVTMGTTGWHVMLAKHIGNIGFVPTLYKLIKTVGQNVIFEQLCSMHECGVEVYYVPSTDKYNFRLGEWKRGMMELKTWNSLQQYKHDTDYEI